MYIKPDAEMQNSIKSFIEPTLSFMWERRFEYQEALLGEPDKARRGEIVRGFKEEVCEFTDQFNSFKMLRSSLISPFLWKTGIGITGSSLRSFFWTKPNISSLGGHRRGWGGFQVGFKRSENGEILTSSWPARILQQLEAVKPVKVVFTEFEGSYEADLVFPQRRIMSEISAEAFKKLEDTTDPILRDLFRLLFRNERELYLYQTELEQQIEELKETKETVVPKGLMIPTGNNENFNF